MPLSKSASADFNLLPTKYNMCLIHDLLTDRKLDFEMAKKIPVPAVLSFWSIKRDCYPSFVPCQEVSVSTVQMHIFQRDMTHIYKPFKAHNFLLKMLMKLSLCDSRKHLSELLTVIHLTGDF